MVSNSILELTFKKLLVGVLVMVRWKRIWLGTIGVWVWSLALFSGLRIWHCCELWCRSQIAARIWCCCGSGVSMAPIRPLAWEPPYAAGVALKRQKDKKKKERSYLLNFAIGSKKNIHNYLNKWLNDSSFF